MTDGQIDVRREEIVTTLAKTRREALQQGVMKGTRELKDGRILAFEVDACFFDGVVAAETKGFFDAEDLPPWDTWLAYRVPVGEVNPLLLSWVPSTLVATVENAIKVHMSNAYRWIDLSSAGG